MNTVVLATSRNSEYATALSCAGYAVTDADNFLADRGKANPGCPAGGGIAVVEFQGDAAALQGPLLQSLKGNGFRPMALCNTCTAELKNFLMAEGVADLLPAGDGAHLARYLDILNAAPSGTAGCFAVLDDNPARVMLFRSIIERFNYSFIAFASAGEFFEHLSAGGTSWALVNLGTRGFDLAAFIRRWLSCSDHRKIPLVPYKDMKEGLMVHEFITGLNRIARVILSPEEVCSLLVNVLFRKEVFPLADSVNRSIEPAGSMNFSAEPLGKIFFSLGMEIFTLENLLTDERFGILNGTIERLKTAMLKASGIRWLIRENCRSATCGPGA